MSVRSDLQERGLPENRNPKRLLVERPISPGSQIDGSPSIRIQCPQSFFSYDPNESRFAEEPNMDTFVLSDLHPGKSFEYFILFQTEIQEKGEVHLQGFKKFKHFEECGYEVLQVFSEKSSSSFAVKIRHDHDPSIVPFVQAIIHRFRLLKKRKLQRHGHYGHGYKPQNDFSLSSSPGKPSARDIAPRSPLKSPSSSVAGDKRRLPFSPIDSPSVTPKKSSVQKSMFGGQRGRRLQAIQDEVLRSSPKKLEFSSSPSDDEFVPPSQTSAERFIKPFQDSSPSPPSQTSSPPLAKTGIKNIGNTCYMASILQAIFNLDAFAGQCLQRALECIRSESRREDENIPQVLLCDTLAGIVARLRADLQSTVDIRVLKDLFSKYNADFRGHEQHDAHEFFTSFLDFVDEKLSIGEGDVESKPGVSCFGFQMENHLKCNECSYERTICEDFSNISVDFASEEAKNITQVSRTPSSSQLFQWMVPKISNLLQKYMDPKFQELKCDRCPCTTVQIVPKFKTLPLVLVIHIKRFSVDLETLKFEKLLSKVDVSTEISLAKLCSSHCSKEWKTFPSITTHAMKEIAAGQYEPFLAQVKSCVPTLVSNPKARYHLKSIAHHNGPRTDSGHYFSDVREGSEWFRFDDHRVSSISEQEVLKTARTNGYLLFYELESSK